MKIVRAFASAVIFLLPVAPAAADERVAFVPTIPVAHAEQGPFKASRLGPAPGDEYFGPLKMSVFGVRNVIDTANAKLDANVPVDTAATMRSLAQVQLSMRAWRAIYPNDHWLPRMYAHLLNVYARLPDPNAKLRGADVASQLVVLYPNSREAADIRAKIAAAFAPAPPRQR